MAISSRLGTINPGLTVPVRLFVGRAAQDLPGAGHWPSPGEKELL